MCDGVVQEMLCIGFRNRFAALIVDRPVQSTHKSRYSKSTFTMPLNSPAVPDSFRSSTFPNVRQSQAIKGAPTLAGITIAGQPFNKTLDLR